VLETAHAETLWRVEASTSSRTTRQRTHPELQICCEWLATISPTELRFWVPEVAFDVLPILFNTKLTDTIECRLPACTLSLPDLGGDLTHKLDYLHSTSPRFSRPHHLKGRLFLAGINPINM